MSTETLVHMAARAHRGSPFLTQRELATWLWARLRDRFPRALAVVIMPDHVHLVTAVAGVESARLDFARLVGNLTRTRVASSELGWERVRLPEAITDQQKAMRQLRYVALNPVRAGLARDPLAWPWSTYRDVMGAVADPWVPQTRVAELFGRPLAGFRASLHRYVSADPSCEVTGSTPATPASRDELSRAPLAWIAEAAAACCNAAPHDIHRRSPTRAIFLALAQRAGSHSPLQVARACSMSSRGVRSSWSIPGLASAMALDAALLCLGDPRLRVTSCLGDGIGVGSSGTSGVGYPRDPSLGGGELRGGGMRHRTAKMRQLVPG